MVCIGYWDDTPSGTSYLRKCVNISGLDFTLNPSWKAAGVTEIYNDEDERVFSDISNNYEFEGIKVKQFSLNDINLPEGIYKSSKIDGRFCSLRAKSYSSWTVGETLNDNMTTVKVEEPQEKQFSMMAVKDRIREAKFNPRMRFRKMIMNYKQAIKSMGGIEKIDEETLKIMKSLFATDVLDLMKTITPDIIAGKPINTLLGASSLGKNVRVTAQKLQMPLKMGLMQAKKQNFVSKNIYEKLQALYTQFVQDLIDEVFSPNSTIPELKDEEEIINEEETK